MDPQVADRAVRELLHGYFSKFASSNLLTTCRGLRMLRTRIPADYVETGNAVMQRSLLGSAVRVDSLLHLPDAAVVELPVEDGRWQFQLAVMTVTDWIAPSVAGVAEEVLTKLVGTMQSTAAMMLTMLQRLYPVLSGIGLIGNMHTGLHIRDSRLGEAPGVVNTDLVLGWTATKLPIDDQPACNTCIYQNVAH